MPKSGTREEWVAARKILLQKEKEFTKASDELAELRRQLPHVKVEKDYSFEGPNGKLTFAELFEGRKQLIVYHFMLGPGDTAGCRGCSFFADNVPTYLEHLNSRDVTFVMVSRAPFSVIEPFKKRMGWTMPWYSSFGSAFNYDFHATNDEAVAPVTSNWEHPETLREKGQAFHIAGEQSGLSVFVVGPQKAIYHTYSTFQRGLDRLLGTYQLLDTTPLGRQDVPQKAGGWAYHDEYEEDN